MTHDDDEALAQVASIDGRVVVKVFCDEPGNFRLKKFAANFDEEEQVSYENAVNPNPGGLYGSLEIAISAAEALVSN